MTFQPKHAIYDGVPELRVVSAYDGLRQHGVGLKMQKIAKEVIDERVNWARKFSACVST